MISRIRNRHSPIAIRQSYHFFLLTALSRAINWPELLLAPIHIICSVLPSLLMTWIYSSPARGGFSLRVNSVRRVAILFDALLEYSFIHPYWQAVLERGRFLRSKDGTHFITASSISTTLSLVRNKMTSIAYNIRMLVSQLKECKEV